MSEPTIGLDAGTDDDRHTDAGDTAASTAPDYRAAAAPRTLGQVLGENVRRLRYERGLDMLQAVAWFRQRGMNVSIRNLQDLERGTQGRLTFGTIVRVALDWQVPVRELFAGDGDVAVASGIRLSREQLRELLRDTGHDDPPPATDPGAPAPQGRTSAGSACATRSTGTTQTCGCGLVCWRAARSRPSPPLPGTSPSPCGSSSPPRPTWASRSSTAGSSTCPRRTITP